MKQWFFLVSQNNWNTWKNHLNKSNFVQIIGGIYCLKLYRLTYITGEDGFASLFNTYVPVTHLYFGEDAPMAVLARIGKYCPRLVELVVSSHDPGPIDQVLITTAKGCPRLSTVDLGDCELTYVHFDAKTKPFIIWNQIITQNEFCYPTEF